MAAAELVSLTGSGLAATIARSGAQLQSLDTAAGERLIWPGDPAIWPDHAPILFPVIGPLPGGMLRHRGKEYPMPAHGFARLSDFTVMERSKSRCTFELRDSKATRASYPFAFRLQVIFELTNEALRVELVVTNSGDETLPADVGFHPGFTWPLTPGRDKRDYLLWFEKPEPAPIRRGIDDPIMLLPERLPTPVEGRILRLRDELFAHNAVVFDRLDSRSVDFGAPGDLGVRVEFPDSPDLALWMRPGASYLCIEPWQGYPSEVDFTGPFATKPGVALIGPSETRRWRLRITPHVFAGPSE